MWPDHSEDTVPAPNHPINVQSDAVDEDIEEAPHHDENRQFEDVIDDDEDDPVPGPEASMEEDILTLANWDREQVMLNPVVFRQMRKHFRFKPSVDLFASSTHRQLPRYYSKVRDPQAVGRDAFQADWQAESAPYANPPWSQISRVLNKVIQDQVRLLLVLPDWQRAPWYPTFQHLCEKSLLLDGPIYLDDEGHLRPKPRWNTRVAVVNGARYLQ